MKKKPKDNAYKADALVFHCRQGLGIVDSIPDKGLVTIRLIGKNRHKRRFTTSTFNVVGAGELLPGEAERELSNPTPSGLVTSFENHLFNLEEAHSACVKMVKEATEVNRS